MEKKLPFVSIVMPVYNGSKFLKEAINSILQQTYDNFEFVIVDDFSTDDSVEIINSFEDRRIRLYSLDKNNGNYFCRNFGIDQCKGDFIATMDCDDISMPSRIKRQVDFLVKNPEIYVLGTWINKINEKGELIEKLKNETNSDLIRAKSLFTMEFFNPTVMFRKEIFKDFGYRYNNNKKSAQDYALLSELAMKYGSSNLPEYLLAYRKSSSQISQKYKLQQTEYFLDAIQERLESFDINFSIERRQLIRALIRNHENLSITLKDLDVLKELLKDIIGYNNNQYLFEASKLKIYLRQIYLDSFQTYRGSFYNYAKTYYQIEFQILKSFSISGVLKLIKRALITLEIRQKQKF